jgi:Ca2+-binding RTX toxin-like protein
LIGGDGDDVITGGDGDDLALMGPGNDRFIWNPGDDTDLVEGGDGNDTVEVNGGNGSEVFTVTANGTRVRFDRIEPAPFSLDIGTCENLVLNANGGNDTFSATGNLAPLLQITVDGGPGNDTILGSNGNDLLLGGDGDDFIDGNQGDDVILMGAGNDVFQWDPGDGNDIVEGESGMDTLVFNGSAIGEHIDISADGTRLRFSRDIGSIVLSCGGIEQVRHNALGGADVITIHDLSSTDVTGVAIALGGMLGSTTGDGQVDNVIINGTSTNDSVIVTGTTDGVSVVGFSPTVTITGSEAANDRLTINLLAGDDIVDASGLLAGIIGFTANGGTGNDVLIGGDGNDVLSGDDGDDILQGGPGLDVLDGGPGVNIVIQD